MTTSLPNDRFPLANEARPADGTDSELSWTEPRWDHAARLHRELLRCLVNRRSLTRVAIASLLAGGGLMALLWLAIPQFVLPANLLWMLLALPGMVAYLYLILVLSFLLPPTIRVSRDAIRYGSNVSGSQMKLQPEQLERIWLTIHADNRIRLRLRYRSGKRLRTRVFCVPPTVNLAVLDRLLPGEPIVRDARSRRLSMFESARRR